MLGFENEINLRKLAKRLQADPADVEDAMEALKYLILHIAKTNCTDQATFELIFEQSGLRDDYRDTLFALVKSHITELRKILDQDNQHGRSRLQNVDWRLSMVTACRQKQKMMVPKYTMLLQFSEGDQNTESQAVLDCDYTMMSRMQKEIQDALKSVENTYSRRVQKFVN